MLYKRYVITATSKNSVVLAKVADELEVFPEAGIMQHVPGIATHREYSPGFNIVVAIEDKAMRMIGYRATINHRLTVIFAGGFQAIQPKQPISGREKADVAGPLSQFGIGNVERFIFNQPGIGKFMAFGKINEIVPVQRATQTFSVQYRIIAHRIRHSTVSIDIREIEFATRLEQAMHFAQYRILVR